MTEKTFLTYSQVDVGIKDLAEIIVNEDYKINTIVAVTRGGLYVALKLSQLLGIKDIRTICLESYEEQKSGELKEIFCADIPDDPATLFVDDLWDSGKTITYIKKKFPHSKTAVVYYKAEDVEGYKQSWLGDDVHYHAEVIDKKAWVEFPWEEEKTLYEIAEEEKLRTGDVGIENFDDDDDISIGYANQNLLYSTEPKQCPPMDVFSEYKSFQGFSLSFEQKKTIKDIEESHKTLILLTGKAGAGKSTIIKELLYRNPSWAICSTTGRSALLINGCTIDKLFAYDRDKNKHFSEFILRANMDRCGDVIIVDEASMMGQKMFESCFRDCMYFGKRLVLVGDWGQASPVKDDWIFNSKDFRESFLKIKLTEAHRQDSGEFLEVLDKVRNGIVDDQVNNLLKSRVFDPESIDLDDKLVIFHSNDLVNSYNRSKVHEFAKSNNKEIFQLYSRAIKVDERLKNAQEKIKQNLENSCFANGEDLCLGCKVLITRNNSAGGYVNGDTGILISKNAKELEVRLDRNNHNVHVVREQIEIKDAQDRLEMIIEGFPIRCGYAFTVHKCQGLTIPKVFVYVEGLMGSHERHGLCYVALSRVKNINDLYLSSWNPKVVSCDNIVKPYL